MRIAEEIAAGLRWSPCERRVGKHSADGRDMLSCVACLEDVIHQVQSEAYAQGVEDAAAAVTALCKPDSNKPEPPDPED